MQPIVDLDASKVLLGKNGRLYLTNDNNRIIDQTEGRFNLSPEQVDTWVERLEARAEWARNHDALYYYSVAPNTHSLYPQFLPDHITLSEDRSVRRVQRALSNGSAFQNYYYPVELMREVSYDRAVAHINDTHWSHYGAFIYLKNLIALINRDHYLGNLSLEDFSVRTERLRGDLGVKVTPVYATQVEILELKAPRAVEVYNNGVRNTGNIRIYEHPDKTLPRAVVFRDSYFNDTAPWFAEFFSRIVYIHQPGVDRHILNAEKPDIIISQQAERYINAIPDDVASPAATLYDDYLNAPNTNGPR